MAYKNALAGLDHGGGKAVIIGDPQRLKSEALLRAYGRFVQSLNGRYITACDVGTYSEDMDIIARECRYVTGRTVPNGGAGDSSVLTAFGVFQGMRAAAEHAWGTPSLRGPPGRRRGRGQGRAPPGRPPDRRRRPGGDLRRQRRRRRAGSGPGTQRSRWRPTGTTCSPAAIDVYSPCALGGSVNDGNLALLNAKIVCGGANNQLAHPGIEKLLADRGIVYAPDYVVNSGGVIQVADELRRVQLRAGPGQGRADLRHHAADPRDRGRRGRAARRRRRPAGRAADVRVGRLVASGSGAHDTCADPVMQESARAVRNGRRRQSPKPGTVMRARQARARCAPGGGGTAG